MEFPGGQDGDGEPGESTRAREQEELAKSPPHCKDRAGRQNDSLPRWGDLFLLLAGTQWGEGGPGHWDCCVALKNMRKTPGDCGLGPVQVDRQKHGPFSSLKPCAHLWSSVKVKFAKLG